MHALDIGIAVIGIVLTIIGIKRGLIGEVIRLLAMVGGAFTAFLYFHDVATFSPFKKLSIQPEIKNAIAFILIYLLSACIILIAGWFLKKIIHLALLGWLDRLLGALIGLLKTFLIAYIACLSISTLPASKIQNDFNKSFTYRTYRTLPNALTLKSLLKKRKQIRNIFNKKPGSSMDNKIQVKIDQFKAVVDSAKEAQTASRKE